MMLVDVERGREDAISLSRELEKMSQSREESEDGLSEEKQEMRRNISVMRGNRVKVVNSFYKSS